MPWKRCKSVGPSILSVIWMRNNRAWRKILACVFGTKNMDSPRIFPAHQLAVCEVMESLNGFDGLAWSASAVRLLQVSQFRKM